MCWLDFESGKEEERIGADPLRQVPKTGGKAEIRDSEVAIRRRRLTRKGDCLSTEGVRKEQGKSSNKEKN